LLSESDIVVDGTPEGNGEKILSYTDNIVSKQYWKVEKEIVLLNPALIHIQIIPIL